MGMGVHIEISLQDGVPIYRQIVNQVKYLIASGQLKPGEELPGIRALAEQVLVTPNTIVKAYDALQAEGLLVKRHGAGTFVAELTNVLTRKEQRRILAQRADTLLAEASQLSFSIEELIDLLKTRHSVLMKSLAKENSNAE
jgi:GntR family transcriptional regulator